MNLGEKILEMRIKANMSQSDLADVLNVSRQSISKWETNSSIPELDKVIKMSEIFSVSIDALVRGEKEVFGKESKDKISKEQMPIEERKLIGIGLLGFGAIIFSLLLVLGGFLTAIVLSSPFFITGFICLMVRKHPGLWSSWVLYLMVCFYLTYATGIRTWWIFHIWVYQNGLTAHAVIAWLMVIALIMLIVLTYRTKQKIIRSLV